MTAPISPNAERKSLFDTVRSILKRGFNPSEVERIDAVLDGKPDPGEPKEAHEEPSVSVPLVRRSRQIGEAGIALIKKFEGCARLRRDGMVEAYPDPGTGGDLGRLAGAQPGPGLRKANGSVQAPSGRRHNAMRVWPRT